jgi:hypothetical protein
MPRKHYSALYKIEDKEFASIVKEAKSYADILRGVNLAYKGGNINTVKRRIELLKLDDSHIPKGMGSNQGREFIYRRYSIDEAMRDVFIVDSKMQRERVKNLLIRFNLIPYRCECGIEGSWRGKKLSLQLEHKNGTANDNRLENLCFMCPNCHSQTSTFAGKSTRKNYKEYDTQEFRNDCKTLTAKATKQKYKISSTLLGKICDRLEIERPVRECMETRKVKNRPSKERLTELIKQYSMVGVGKMFSVSDNAVRKWCKSYNIAL